MTPPPSDASRHVTLASLRPVPRVAAFPTSRVFHVLYTASAASGSQAISCDGNELSTRGDELLSGLGRAPGYGGIVTKRRRPRNVFGAVVAMTHCSIMAYQERLQLTQAMRAGGRSRHLRSPCLSRSRAYGREGQSTSYARAGTAVREGAPIHGPDRPLRLSTIAQCTAALAHSSVSRLWRSIAAAERSRPPADLRRPYSIRAIKRWAW